MDETRFSRPFELLSQVADVDIDDVAGGFGREVVAVLDDIAACHQFACAPREQFKYFYDERNPQSVLTAMDTALKKLKN